MDRSTQKVIQYLNEAHATEVAAVTVLQAQAAMTPKGSYRSAVEKHLKETQGHAQRLEERLGELGVGGNPLQAAVGLAESLIGQAMAIVKTPVDLVRGTGGEEKVLKQAKDSCAAEALEIATYTSIETLATSVGDEKTAKLAASIRADEERMLATVMAELPRLTEAVKRADVDGDKSYELSETGAADAVKATSKAAQDTASKAESRARSTASKASGKAKETASKAESRTRSAASKTASKTESKAKSGAAKSRSTASKTASKTESKAKSGAAKSRSTARKTSDRAKTGTARTSAKASSKAQSGAAKAGGRTQPPFPGYDDMTVEDITKRVADSNEERRKAVRDYERSHKARAGVIEAAERQPASAGATSGSSSSSSGGSGSGSGSGNSGNSGSGSGSSSSR